MTTPNLNPTSNPTPWRPPPNAPCIQLATTNGPTIAANTFMPERIDPFTGNTTPNYDAGAHAIRLCTTCPARRECLAEKMRRNERLAIMGAAGGARHRALRRAWLTGGNTWTTVEAAHWRDVDGHPQPGDRELLRSGTSNRDCGRRGSFAVGCRCDACGLATGVDGARHRGGITAGLAARFGTAA